MATEKQLYESGLSLREIERKLGISHQTVANRLRAQGVEIRAKKKRFAEPTTIRLLPAEREALESEAAAKNTSVTAVVRRKLFPRDSHKRRKTA